MDVAVPEVQSMSSRRRARSSIASDGSRPANLRDGQLRGSLARPATQRQMAVLAAFADLRARSGLTTEQLIYSGWAGGWLVVPSPEPR